MLEQVAVAGIRAGDDVAEGPASARLLAVQEEDLLGPEAGARIEERARCRKVGGAEPVERGRRSEEATRPFVPVEILLDQIRAFDDRVGRLVDLPFRDEGAGIAVVADAALVVDELVIDEQVEEAGLGGRQIGTVDHAEAVGNPDEAGRAAARPAESSRRRPSGSTRSRPRAARRPGRAGPSSTGSSSVRSRSATSRPAGTWPEDPGIDRRRPRAEGIIEFLFFSSVPRCGSSPARIRRDRPRGVGGFASRRDSDDRKSVARTSVGAECSRRE
jgi:hypothetical protein